MSLKVRLFLLLSAATGLVWLSAVLWIDHSTRGEVEKVLDARLREAATMVSSLISDRRIDVTAGSPGPLSLPTPDGTRYSRQLSCQIWSLEGGLLGRSEGAPSARLTSSTQTGFSQTMVDGELWRVYATVNPELGVRVMVGDAVEVRDRLVRDVMTGFAVPAAVVLPLLAALIWLSVGRGLKPLDRLAQGLRARNPQDLSPLPVGPAPREIRPVRRALNRLFAEVEAVRATERDFVAFAAHELKTPMAGLRMQAQIARIAEDEDTRRHALQTIEHSVDRTDRLVRQLLELAAVERHADTSAPADLNALITDVVRDLGAIAARHGVQINVTGDGVTIRTVPYLVHAALRNVLENAIAASPEGGTVRICLERCADGVSISVQDQGPGIAPAQLGRITERFYRPPGARQGGSGLGLAIVASAVERLGGRMDLPPPAGAGQTVRLVLST
ncbi:ATP-binding protein [Roseovarius sp. M141]|uniref:ATP-binding protein n=1 Tax=Roseovarius sp. M141 TaxID=2583806 RepID=UPI0020CC9EF6|nr:ATP-binding protein [Roseovarius sp. M141]MCQ0092334.1 HAMP domain-containing protein [Roseovarius sp. M141]